MIFIWFKPILLMPTTHTRIHTYTGNMFTDAMMDYVDWNENLEADLAIINSGAFRADLDKGFLKITKFSESYRKSGKYSNFHWNLDYLLCCIFSAHLTLLEDNWSNDRFQNYPLFKPNLRLLPHSLFFNWTVICEYAFKILGMKT